MGHKGVDKIIIIEYTNSSNSEIPKFRIIKEG